MQPESPHYVTWQSVRYKPELVVKTVLIREYSNGEKLYHDLDAKGKKIRIWYSVPNSTCSAPAEGWLYTPPKSINPQWEVFALAGQVWICRMHGTDFGCSRYYADTIGM